MSNNVSKQEIRKLVESVLRTVGIVNQQRDHLEKTMTNKMVNLQTKLTKVTQVFNEAVKFKSQHYFNYEASSFLRGQKDILKK